MQLISTYTHKPELSSISFLNFPFKNLHVRQSKTSQGNHKGNKFTCMTAKKSPETNAIVLMVIITINKGKTESKTWEQEGTNKGKQLTASCAASS